MKRQLRSNNSVMTQFLVEMSSSLKRWMYFSYCHFEVNVFLLAWWWLCFGHSDIDLNYLPSEENSRTLVSGTRTCVLYKIHVLDKLKQHYEKEPEISLTIKLHCCRCRLFNNALLKVLLFRDGVSYIFCVFFPRALEPDAEETRVFRPWGSRPRSITWQLQMQMFLKNTKQRQE